MGGSASQEWAKILEDHVIRGRWTTLDVFLDQFYADHKPHGMTPLMGLAHWNAFEAVQALITRFPQTLLECDYNGLTPLMWAARSCGTESLKIILGDCSNVCQKDAEGLTALDWAFIDGGTPNIITLIEHPKINPLLTDTHHISSLLRAINYGDIQIANFVLDRCKEQARQNPDFEPILMEQLHQASSAITQLKQKAPLRSWALSSLEKIELSYLGKGSLPATRKNL